ncbi:MAG: hypothetical protein ABEJ68_04750 [Halobacteriaceae archaeon]
MANRFRDRAVAALLGALLAAGFTLAYTSYWLQYGPSATPVLPGTVYVLGAFGAVQFVRLTWLSGALRRVAAVGVVIGAGVTVAGLSPSLACGAAAKACTTHVDPGPWALVGTCLTAACLAVDLRPVVSERLNGASRTRHA